MPLVRAHGLVKTFGTGRAARRVLDGAELSVEPGELVAVLGRSGSGKSTLLHVLGGLDRPEGGVVEIAGERVTGASERELSSLRRRRIGFVFQFFHLLPELSGEANVLLPGRVRGASPEAAARGRELIAAAPAARRRRAAAVAAPAARPRRAAAAAAFASTTRSTSGRPCAATCSTPCGARAARAAW